MHEESLDVKLRIFLGNLSGYIAIAIVSSFSRVVKRTILVNVFHVKEKWIYYVVVPLVRVSVE